MLKLTSITRRYGEKTVLQQLTHTFPQRGVVALMGDSGCGKTTLMRLICGLDTPDEGEIVNTYAKTSVAFQEPRLLPWLTARQNLLAVLPRDAGSAARAEEQLRAVELADAADRYPYELSGGMQKRLSLARALAYGGDLLLLDEPFSALDQALRARIAPLIRAANPSGLTLVVTHDPTDAELLGAALFHCTGKSFPLSQG